MRVFRSCIMLLTGFMISHSACAWNADGHHTVGALASKLIVGTHAATGVKSVLGKLRLKDAAVWADCAKGIDPSNGFKYTHPGKYPECKIYETTQGEAEMADFVRRNFDNCAPKPGEEICHKQYHYTDISILKSEYEPTFVGARVDDVVAAINAAIHVLKGDAAPAPFDIKDKREALLVLTHYMGDLHQPLHVGAIYLDQTGQEIDPDASGFDPTTDTRGGNNLLVNGKSFHIQWDGIPTAMTVPNISTPWVKKAAALPTTSGDIYGWSRLWATDTLMQAHEAFRGVQFDARVGTHWNTKLPAGYTARANKIKKTQLTAAGAHLAQILQAIWP